MPQALFSYLSLHTGRVNGLWRKLIGFTPQFTLEARIFHSISLGVIILAVGYIPYNLFARLYVAATSCIFISIFFLYEYYRSRFRGQPYRSFLFGLVGLILLPVNYFSNAGIAGSTDLIWPVYLLFLLTICAKPHQFTWVIAYLLVFGLVHLAEHWYPDWVQYPFSPGNGQFRDRITAFPMPVIGIALVIGLFRRNYDRERAKVVQRDAEKSRLLSLLSHDFRAPLIQISQYLELLNTASLPQDERTKMEQLLREMNNQTLDMVTNLLYWSRAQLDGVATHIMPLLLLEVLENPLAIARALAAQKHITFRQHINPEIEVSGDRDMLQLVIRNLLQNAIKFTPGGGVIAITATTGNNWCTISVSDTGSGIPQEQLDSLFSGKNTPNYGTENEKGVGLGLTLCQEFIERQGGRIYVKSRTGKGSRFSIELPLTAKLWAEQTAPLC